MTLYRIVWIEIGTGASGESRIPIPRELAIGLMNTFKIKYPNRLYDLVPVVEAKEK